MAKWIVNVPVATVWTSFDSPREIDNDAVTNPGRIESWLEGLTYETRLELCNENLVQTQVLYGEEVLVLEENGDWAHVIIPSQSTKKEDRGYPGWVPKAQLVEAPDGWNLTDGPVAVVTSQRAKLFKENDPFSIELSYLTTLPFIKEQARKVYVKTPYGTAVLDTENVVVSDSPARGNGQAIVSAGEQFLGLPYLWGGMSSFGYDCSGFSYSMCKANGYVIPRDASDQAAAGEKVELTDIEPGDLLFFAYEEGKGRIHHVGIYYGEGKLLHSPKTGKTVEIIPLEGTIYERELCAARRYWVKTEA
ncbi:C40 family peptidase [Paenibacillus sp. BSR1-1]|uniref:C40 family peptidase n=1 Tax=Paenibacillus sp. BSR1-1 TaxID=3020845 RepID=UPI0025AEF6E3|nr:C40 family peptidase [Paenibacillus sp. BSR1-1]MDN3020051.1 C40 family peptidase [Paenibacillus sp. BSR1-1]